ncbi:urate hydroxylase PuuD [Porticoccus sp. W117]|uniref:urate hydroxylase PuuD n=1 Tax=Porticoccus sp. W117 TaxID=3054777 RepID=UPI0025994F6D|nr:urate hydroxylase PuuD [Porticoccus sp. W117]MDM3872335.1 urate hydroxylase PuuD [Porticoccus sp. W117]
MESYILDWLSLIFRWMHVITGVAWIGASFYFIWLDNSLENPPQWKKDKGIKGDLWAIHGGGIYEVAKYQLAPEQMPKTLHWFKWEAYSTWLTGIVLLTLIYYLGADAYLIDKRVADLTQSQAILIGVGFLLGSWVGYEMLCRSPIAKNGIAIGAILILAAVGLAYTLTQLFSGRGAYIHMGAIIGTIMAGNVFRVIMPSQRALLAAIEKGEQPDPAWGKKAKLHSTHNTHLTLPLIFIMISAHYPFTYTHQYNWLVLLAIIVITAAVRQYFVIKHKGVKKPGILVGSAVATLVLAILIAPKFGVEKISTHDHGVQSSKPSVITAVKATEILHARCASCHSRKPTDDVFTVAPGGVFLENVDDMRKWAARINARSVTATDMPFLNKTLMTDEERTLIGRWISAGTPE